MASRKNVYSVAAVIVVLAGIAVYYPSQQQAAIAQISSNTTNPVNNSNMSRISNTTNPVNNSNMTTTPTAFSTDTIQHNITYGEWTARWWQWLYSIPEERNPAADETGANCHEGQSGPVWFLAGTFGGLNERVCTIPAGKSLLFPVVNQMCTFIDYPNLQTETELRSCAVRQMKGSLN